MVPLRFFMLLLRGGIKVDHAIDLALSFLVLFAYFAFALDGVCGGVLKRIFE